MKIQPDEISAILKSQINNFQFDIDIDETGKVIQVGDGIARIYGLNNVMAGEMIEFPGGVVGMALNLEEDNVGCIIFGETRKIKEGDIARRTQKILQVPIGDALLGRVVNSLGEPIDGKGEIKAEKYKPVAVWVVHIGGHIAFQIEEIANFCKEKNIILLEDCAHAHGASWKGKKAGTWGDVGVYSFYATKTITTGEGGMLVTKNLKLVEFAKKYRNYGKFDYKVKGLNFRMNEFTAAIGCVQVDRLDQIVSWKNEYAKKYLDPKFPNRVKFPDGMISGYYKYIVFDPIENSTGKVYDTPCHKILGKEYELPNTEWIAENHWCVPIYYKGDKLD